MKYKIVEGNYTLELEQNVNEYLHEGWELVGGVEFRVVGGMQYYLQAMILKS